MQLPNKLSRTPRSLPSPFSICAYTTWRKIELAQCGIYRVVLTEEQFLNQVHTPQNELAETGMGDGVTLQAC